MKLKRPLRKPPKSRKQSEGIEISGQWATELLEGDLELPLLGHEHGRAHILLIDDDKDQLSLFAKVIRGGGYEVVTAESAQKGLTLIEKKNIDLIVCDVVMPGMDGVEFLHSLRAADTTSDIPVVMISAGNQAMEMALLEAGADTFCAKAKIAKDLLKQVKMLLA